MGRGRALSTLAFGLRSRCETEATQDRRSTFWVPGVKNDVASYGGYALRHETARIPVGP